MLNAQALKPILEQVLGEYTMLVVPANKVERATYMVELATAALCVAGVSLGKKEAVILAARVVADMMVLFEREVADGKA